MNDTKKLSGKVALITGAGSGMGQAMAREFAAQGAAVIAADIVASRAAETAKGIEGDGGRAIAVEIDVADSASVEAAVAKGSGEFGPITLLCSNAGVLDDYKPVLETDESEWDRVIDINLKGMYLTSRAVLGQMIDAGGGVIVNTASISGLVAGGGGAAYTSSKLHPPAGLRLRAQRGAGELHLSWRGGDRDDQRPLRCQRGRGDGKRQLGSGRPLRAAFGDREAGSLPG
jgi:NAD(P)-dependent dehydrogenase (short-subunit alcohol dehydrogenase family)